MATKQGPLSYQYVDLDPNVERSEDQANHVIRIHLPGFRREEFRVQVDGSGKVTIRGQRPLADGRFSRFIKAVQLPPDSDIDKIRGTLEGEHLAIVCPKKATPEKKDEQPAVPPQKVEPKADEKKERPQPGEKKGEAAPAVKEEPRREEESEPGRKKEEAAPAAKEEPRSGTRREEEREPVREKKEEAAPAAKEEPKSAITRREDEREPGEKKEEAAPAAKEKPKSGVRREEEREPGDKKGEAAPAVKEEPKIRGVPRSSAVLDGWASWGQRMAEELEGYWPVCRSAVDTLAEAIEKNKKVIAVAAAAYSLGFFVSQKLRSRG